MPGWVWMERWAVRMQGPQVVATGMATGVARTKPGASSSTSSSAFLREAFGMRVSTFILLI